MPPPIQVTINLNVPIKCSGPECGHIVDDQSKAVFVVRHIMVVAYCCSRCYLNAWRAQLVKEDPQRDREDILESLGYYPE